MESNVLYEHTKVITVLAFMSAQLSLYNLCNACHRKLHVISANTKKQKQCTRMDLCSEKGSACGGGIGICVALKVRVQVCVCGTLKLGSAFA